MVCVMLHLHSILEYLHAYQPVCIQVAIFPRLQHLQMTHSLPESAASTQSKETDLEVGRWGEELVYRFLLAHASTDISQKGLQQTPAESAWQIEWVNQDFNTSLPFDLRLRQVSQHAFASLTTD